ncbi:hypothetical protein [Vibrio parahaemolyticus]|uniref:hypothetical protein n=1 Tax=Vibrio parahaemolyticus TaxID=670 RepID=UPI0009897FAD|nr:hypothetical protein [Vibrio parahaemolyticus]EJL6727388.1 hypothetical protein [Vibrio alginolyticus]OOQ62410.1 hypothetical protein BSR59_25030 [Vibrio parahaemolyticus]OOQ72180.1 hypothetical protein BSR63_24625 [Vibrio parahaemolyticus]QEL40108.1 hypothetical protein BSR23_008365 [Vibrio parahaemolyticus]
MREVPTYSAEIEVYLDNEEGMRLECSELYASELKSSLVNLGFSCGETYIAIEGTSNIHNYVGFSIEGDQYNQVKDIIFAYLGGKQITYVEEQFNSNFELHSRINLTNRSTFDKS